MESHWTVFLTLFMFAFSSGADGVLPADDVSNNNVIDRGGAPSNLVLVSPEPNTTVTFSETTTESISPTTGLHLSDNSSLVPSNRDTTPSDPKNLSALIVTITDATGTTTPGTTPGTTPNLSSPTTGATNESTTILSTSAVTEVTMATSGTVPPLPVSSAGVSTVALVVISILLAIAFGLTLIYALRYYNIRRRRSDRRGLLSSVSQEGFFVNAENRYDNL